jgi:hypothetical protein
MRRVFVAVLLAGQACLLTNRTGVASDGLGSATRGHSSALSGSAEVPKAVLTATPATLSFNDGHCSSLPASAFGTHACLEFAHDKGSRGEARCVQAFRHGRNVGSSCEELRPKRDRGIARSRCRADATLYQRPGAISPVIAQRIVDLEYLLDRALRIFYPDEVGPWLTQPEPYLGGAIPAKCSRTTRSRTGRRCVDPNRAGAFA